MLSIVYVYFIKLHDKKCVKFDRWFYTRSTNLVEAQVIEGGAKDDDKDGVSDCTEGKEQELEQDEQVDGEAT